MGDTEFLIDEQVDKFRFLEENERVIQRRAGRRRRSRAARHHQGVALDRVVHLGGLLPGDDEGTHRGGDLRQIDYLRGLKENVTMGRLIPAGTGFWWYRHVAIPPMNRHRRRRWCSRVTRISTSITWSTWRTGRGAHRTTGGDEGI